MLEGLFQPFHILVILIIILILFGPGKMQEMGSAIGKAIREFKRAMSKIDINLKDDLTQNKPMDIKKPEDQNNHINKQI
jgi:sec-independent protein translocase protein TatA